MEGLGGVGVSSDLGLGEGLAGVAGGEGIGLEIPRGGLGEGSREVPNGLPAEQVESFVRGEVEFGGLVEGVGVGDVGPGASGVFQEFLNEAVDRAVGIERGTEVEGAGEGGGWEGMLAGTGGGEAGGEVEVAGERFEDVLPRAGGDFITDGDRLAGSEGAEAVGDDAISRPVASTDHVPRTGAGEEDGGGGMGEVGAAIRGDGEFRSSFTGAVGIVSAHGVFLAVGVQPFAVFVTFICGDHDRHTGMSGATQSIHDVDGAHNVSSEGGNRNVVREPDKGLGGKVEDEVGLDRSGEGGEAGSISKVASVVSGEAGGEAELIE